MLDGLLNLIMVQGQSVDQEQCLKMVVQCYLSKREVADPSVFLLDLKQLPVDFYPDYFTLVKFKNRDSLIGALVTEIDHQKFTKNQKKHLLACGGLWMRFNPHTKEWIGLSLVPRKSRFNYFKEQSLAQSISDAYSHGHTSLNVMHCIIFLIKWLPPHDVFPFLTQAVSLNILPNIPVPLPVHDCFIRVFLTYYFPNRYDDSSHYDHREATIHLEHMGLTGHALTFFKIRLMFERAQVPPMKSVFDESFARLGNSLNYLINSPGEEHFAYRLRQFCLSELILNPSMLNCQDPTSLLRFNDDISSIILNAILPPQYWREKASLSEEEAMARYEAAIPKGGHLYSRDWESLPFFQGVTIHPEATMSAFMNAGVSPFFLMCDEAFFILLTHYRPPTMAIYINLNTRLRSISSLELQSHSHCAETVKRVIITYPMTVFSDTWFNTNYTAFTSVLSKEGFDVMSWEGIRERLDVNHEFEALMDEIYPEGESNTSLFDFTSSGIGNSSYIPDVEIRLFRLLVNIPTRFCVEILKQASCSYEPVELFEYISDVFDDGKLSNQQWRALMQAQISVIVESIAKSEDAMEEMIDYYIGEYTTYNILNKLILCVEIISPEERCDFFIEVIALLKLDDGKQRDMAIILLIPMMPSVDHERFVMRLYTQFDPVLLLLQNDDVAKYFIVSHDADHGASLRVGGRPGLFITSYHFLVAIKSESATISYPKPLNFEELRNQMLAFTVHTLTALASDSSNKGNILNVLNRYCPEDQAGNAFKLALCNPHANQLKLRVRSELKSLLVHLGDFEIIDLFFGDCELYKMLLRPPLTWWSIFNTLKGHENAELLSLNIACYQRLFSLDSEDFKQAFNNVNNQSAMFINLFTWLQAYLHDIQRGKSFFSRFFEIAEILDVDDAAVFERFEQLLSDWVTKYSYTIEKKMEFYENVLNAIPKHRRQLFSGLKIHGDQYIREFLEQGTEPKVNRLKPGSI